MTLPLPNMRPLRRRVVVGFSGGVTSAWCAGWALRNFPRDEVVLLWHDTKREHRDTYRFKDEMAAKLGVPVVERSDGRSVLDVFADEGFLGNNQNTMCSRILKAQQDDLYFDELRAEAVRDGVDLHLVKVVGYSAREPDRVNRMVGRFALQLDVSLRFPIIEERVTKQQCADWVQCEVGVRPSAMYEWAEHANCVGCVKGGRAYWLAVLREHPDVYWEMAALEDEYGHSIIRGGDREPITLRELAMVGLKRKVNMRERIEIGACECGD